MVGAPGAGATTLNKDATVGRWDVVLAVVYYAISSSLMLVINKIAVAHLPLPGLLACVQFLVTTLAVLAARAAGLIRCEQLSWRRARHFAPYVVSFVLSVYCNLQALKATCIETVILSRALAPALVCLVEHFFLGLPWPDRRSRASLLLMFVLAALYVEALGKLRLDSISSFAWPVAYMLCVVFSMAEGKRLVLAPAMAPAPLSPPALGAAKGDASGDAHSVPAAFFWDPVLYSNALSLPGMLVLALGSGEVSNLAAAPGAPLPTTLCVLASCFCGLLISRSGWHCRAKISATSYTVLGFSCKALALLVNTAVGQRGAPATAAMWLVLCIGAGAMYRPPSGEPAGKGAQGDAEAAGDDGDDDDDHGDEDDGEEDVDDGDDAACSRRRRRTTLRGLIAPCGVSQGLHQSAKRIRGSQKSVILS